MCGSWQRFYTNEIVFQDISGTCLHPAREARGGGRSRAEREQQRPAGQPGPGYLFAENRCSSSIRRGLRRGIVGDSTGSGPGLFTQSNRFWRFLASLRSPAPAREGLAREIKRLQTRFFERFEALGLILGTAMRWRASFALPRKGADDIW